MLRESQRHVGNFSFIAAGNFTTADFRGVSGMDGRFDGFDSLAVRIIVSVQKKISTCLSTNLLPCKVLSSVIKKHEFNKLF